MAVIGDVAKYAGVSKSTVSKFLNNPELLTEEYRLKVAKAVKDLNYTPSNIARSMRTKNTKQIALIVPDIANPFYTEMFSEMRSYAMQLGYRVFVYTTEDDLAELEKYIDNINNIYADGIIIGFLDEDQLIMRLDEIRDVIPITFISWDIHRTGFNSVVLCLNDSFFTITQYMINQGHKKVAFIGGPENSRITKEKLDGFCRAMNMAGLRVNNEYIKYGSTGLQNGYHNTLSLIRLSDPPTAIVASTDEIAIGSIKCLLQHNYKIPEDIAVSGHDGIRLSYLFDPSITTQSIPIPEVCKTSIDLLLNKIERPGSKNRQAVFSTNLIEGRNTNPNAPNIIHL